VARITPPSLEQLAVFSGREEESYTDFADQALIQATVLFQIASCLDTLPSNTASVEYDVCVNGILDMADRLYLGRQYATAKYKYNYKLFIDGLLHSREENCATDPLGSESRSMFYAL